jgi:hypothetical protein
MSTAAWALEILRAYESALATLPQRLHASWLAPWGLTRLDALSISKGDASRTGAWSTALGLPCLPFGAFQKTANRLAILPRPLLWRVLRTRALLQRRKALRRCIDPIVRARLAAWLQPEVLSAVLRDGPESLDDTADLPIPLTTQHRNSLDDALAEEGFWLFNRDALWDADPGRLIKFCFPREAIDPLSVAARGRARRFVSADRSDDRSDDASDDTSDNIADHSQWVLDRLDKFVPEAAWLSG